MALVGTWIPTVEKQRWVFGSLELWLAERTMTQILPQTRKEGRLLCSKAGLSIKVPKCGLTMKGIICLFVFLVRVKLNMKAKAVQAYLCAELSLRLISGKWGRRSCWYMLGSWFKTSESLNGTYCLQKTTWILRARARSKFWQYVYPVPRDISSWCTVSPSQYSLSKLRGKKIKNQKSTKRLGPRGDALVGIIFLVVEFQQFRRSSDASPYSFNDVCCQRREPQERTGL